MLEERMTEPDLILEGCHLGRGSKYFDEEVGFQKSGINFIFRLNDCYSLQLIRSVMTTLPRSLRIFLF